MHACVRQACGVVVGWLLLSSLSSFAADPEAIKAATERGITSLRRHQGQNGAWDHQHPIGATALAALTLVECEVDRDDVSIQKAADYLRSAIITPTFTYSTYSISLAIMFFDRLGDPDDEELIKVLGRRLLRGQNAAGGWSYECPFDAEDHRRLTTKPKQAAKNGGNVDDGQNITRPGNPSAPGFQQRIPPGVGVGDGGAPQFAGINPEGDNSNTQFATLALWVARRHGIAADNALAVIEARFRQSQNADGGWCYLARQFGPLSRSTISMTSAGLLGLAVAYGVAYDRKLRDDAPAVNPKTGRAAKANQRRDPNRDDNVRAALLALGRMIAAGQVLGPLPFNPAGPRPGPFPAPPGQAIPPNIPGAGTLDYYALWSVERVGVVYGLRTFDKRDWYEWGTRLILASESPQGGWAGKYQQGGVDTCFALLFLQRSNLATDLTSTLRGKIVDPGERRLTAGGVGGAGLRDQNSQSTSELDEPPKNGEKGKRRSSIPELSLGSDKAAAGGAAGSSSRSAEELELDAQIARLSDRLVRAQGEEQQALIAKLRENKGLVNTQALASAIPQLDGPAKTKARDALAQRLSRMTTETLRDKMNDEDVEVRRAAALACALKEEKGLVPDLAKLLEDDEVLVVRAVRAALKDLTGQDFGPANTGNRRDRALAISRWKEWWAAHGSK
jgi:hypothetical protein